MNSHTILQLYSPSINRVATLFEALQAADQLMDIDIHLTSLVLGGHFQLNSGSALHNCGLWTRRRGLFTEITGCTLEDLKQLQALFG